MDNKKNVRFSGMGIYMIIVIIAAMFIMYVARMNTGTSNYTYNELVNDISKGKIESVSIRQNAEVPTGVVTVKVSGEQSVKSVYVSDVKDVEELLLDKNIEYTLKDVARQSVMLTTILPFGLSLLVIVFIMMMFTRQAGGGGNAKMMNFGKSRARMISSADNKVTFKDVAGLQEEKEELELLIANAKPDSCMEEKNCKKLSLYLNTANTKQDRSSYIQCAILPEADKYPQAVKVIADIFQQYNIPLLLQASLQKKYGPEVFAKEGTAMWHALGEKMVDKNSPAEKNTSLCYPNLSSAYGECYTGAAYVTAVCLCMGAEPMADTQLPRELYKYSGETQSEIEYDPYGCMLIGNGSTMYIKDFNTLEGKRIHVL